MDSITVKNESGQTVQIGLPEGDPKSKARREIVEQRIARGELTKASGKSGGDPAGRAAVLDYHTGLRDEKGDLLKSVHGGGLDPDADGDALGEPSGSGAKSADKDAKIAEDYVERLETVETKVETKSTSKK